MSSNILKFDKIRDIIRELYKRNLITTEELLDAILSALDKPTLLNALERLEERKIVSKTDIQEIVRDLLEHQII